jgi:CIC family chloride channel protein
MAADGQVEGAAGAAKERHRALGTLALSLLSVALGIVAGVGAFGFRVLIGFLHNLFFLKKLSWIYDSNLHTPIGPWGRWVALAPAVGGVFVVFLVKNLAPEAKGHGVPEVMDAVYYKKGVIRPVVALVKSMASALSIGSGGSVGREGPIIQIGAAFASSVGQLARASRWQLATLVAAGGGAGIAATFNTPIGGVLFAVEILMLEISVRTLVPVALATATATHVGRYLLGNHPAFDVPATATNVASGFALLPAYVLLGCLMALVSVVFIRAIYGAEDLFERLIPERPYLRHVVGMLGVGLTAVLLMRFAGHYYVEGVGYATILDILSGTLNGIGLLLALLALKLLATSLTLGSGASGGVFSPSLFMGATLGAAFGLTLRACLPGLQINPAAFALAGMAGLVAGATGAALTAIVMIFEMTLDYGVILPLTITAAVSYGLRRAFFAESIYTMKLTRRGHYMPQALQANAHLVQRVSDLRLEPVLQMSADDPPDALDLRKDAQLPSYVVLLRGDTVVGVIAREWASTHEQRVHSAMRLADLARHDFVIIPGDETLVDLLARMVASHAFVAVVGAGEGRAGETEAKTSVAGIVTLAGMAEARRRGWLSSEIEKRRETSTTVVTLLPSSLISIVSTPHWEQGISSVISSNVLASLTG